MIKKFRNLSLELHTDNLGKHSVRLDNTLNNQYVNIITTTNKVQALLLFQDLYDVLNKHQEGDG